MRRLASARDLPDDGMMPRARWDLVCGAVAALGLMAMAWVWQGHVTRRAVAPIESESWQHVRERFPMPSETVALAPASEELPNAIVQANPFSPDRRPPPSASSSSTTASPVTAPEPPQFVYKGRIMMNDTPRAIVEDVAKKKTYFVQAGQEMNGYRVEDIQAHAVMLTELATHASRVIPLAAKSPSSSSVSSGAAKPAGIASPAASPTGKPQSVPATP